MKKCGSIGLLVVTTAASGLSLADCPNTLPLQLLEDCIVSEGAGQSFPPGDYVYMDQYQDWQKTQRQLQPIVISNPKASAKPKI
jgi:hypothetical protein